MLKLCPASMSHKRRVEWTVKDWIRKLDRKFLVDERKIALSLATVKFIPSFLTWQTFNLFSCPQTPRQFFSKWTKVSLEALKRITQGQFCVCYAETWRKWALSKYFIFTSNKILADSWKTITKETVINYLEKAGIKLTFKRLPLLIQIINLTHFRQMFHLFINQIAGFY